MSRKSHGGHRFDGVLVVDKASGPSSHDIVSALRRLLQMRRIGHCGTLDPLATGVLVVCLGLYTRLSDFVSATDKKYDATIVLGSTSPTGDGEGPVSVTVDAPVPARELLEEHVRRFTGALEQVPHPYSAIKVNGTRSYRLARLRTAPELSPRTVRIDELLVTRYEPPEVDIKVTCSKGTYVRSLAVDLGESLGCGGYVKSLRRVRVGELGLSSALTMEEVASAVKAGTVEEQLVNPKVVLSALPHEKLNVIESQAFAQGRKVTVAPGGELGECAIFVSTDSGEKFAGIGERTAAGELRPVKVFIQPRNDGVLDLGCELRFSGVVEHGAGRGADLGFPTANLLVGEGEEGHSTPALGVFAATVSGEGLPTGTPAVINVGTRPTFDEEPEVVVVELHLIDFTGDLYGCRLDVCLVERLRQERRFESVDALVAQLHRDVANAKRVIEGAKSPEETKTRETRTLLV